MDIGTLLVALTVGIAPLALGVGLGYAALVASMALFQTALQHAASEQTAPRDNVVQMPIPGRLTESGTVRRRAA